ncbi:DoxX family protein [Brevibacterium casei]|uniref:DoxX family protein n=1 Tax=Brevibacterium casei TaxID=33889 RepID=UPI0028AE98A9|nr:MauE/DoxX family redox-associated membrane protein [Brevibacterium casei]
MTFSPGKRGRGSSATPRTLFMSGLLGFAGTMHFIRPKTFDSIVPPSLGNRRAWTYASGVAEIGCAALLAVPATRRIGGAATAALMVAVYPANIYTVVKHRKSPKGRAIALARLPLQIPLVQMSWAIARGADSRS